MLAVFSRQNWCFAYGFQIDCSLSSVVYKVYRVYKVYGVPGLSKVSKVFVRISQWHLNRDIALAISKELPYKILITSPLCRTCRRKFSSLTLGLAQVQNLLRYGREDSPLGDKYALKHERQISRADPTWNVILIIRTLSKRITSYSTVPNPHSKWSQCQPTPIHQKPKSAHPYSFVQHHNTHYHIFYYVQ